MQPTKDMIEAAAKMMCYRNGIPECAGYCTPETCQHGIRDFSEDAAAIVGAALAKAT